MPVLQQVTAFKLSGFTYDGSSTQFNYTANVTAGTGTANKALVLDSYKNISNINDISITGKIKINSELDDSQFVVNSVTGDCLKLIYNEVNGVATFYSNINVTNNGNLSLKTSGSDVSIDATNNLNVISHDGSTKGLKLNNILVTATANQLNYLSSLTTPGTVVANKALIVDSNKDLESLRNLTLTGTLTTTNVSSTNLTGTIQTAAQPNITSLGELSNLTITNNLTAGTLTGVIQTANQTNITRVGTLTSLNITGLLNSTGYIQTTAFYYSAVNMTNYVSYQGNWAAANDCWGIGQENGTTIRLSVCTPAGLNSGYANLKCANITSTGSLTATTLIGSLQTAAQPNVTSVGTLTGLNVSGVCNLTNNTNSVSNSTGALILAGGIGITNTTDAINSTNGGSFTTAGGMGVGKKLYVGSDLNVTGNISGILQTSAQPNITSLGTLTGLTISGSQSITQSNQNLLSTLLFTNSGDNVTWEYGLRGSLSANNPGTLYWFKSGFKMTLTDTGCLTIGNNIVSQTTYNLSTGSANFTNLYLNGTQMTSSATELNYLSSLTIGFVTASKALVVDSNKDLSGIRNLTLTGNLLGLNTLTLNTLVLGSTTLLSSATDLNYLYNTIAGTATASKALVLDSNKTLSGIGNIRTIGNMGINTNVVGKQFEINSSTGDCLRLTYNNSNGTPTVYCDQTISSTGMVTMSANGTSPGFTFSGGNINGTLGTNSQPNITSVGTLTGLSLSGALNSTSSLSTSSFILSSIADPALSNIVGGLTGGGYWGIGQENSTTVRLSTCSALGANASYANFKCGNITSTGSITAGSNLVINGSLSGVTSLTTNTLILGSTTITTTGSQINALNIANPGYVYASKFLMVDSNRALGVSAAPLGNLVSDGTISTSNSFIHTNGTVNFQTSISSTNFYLGNTTNHSLNFTTGGITRMTILSNGNIGIKTTPPSNISLDVLGNIRGSILLSGDSADTSATKLLSATDSTIVTYNGTNLANSSRSICLGKINTNYNQSEITYVHAGGDGINQNYLKLGFTGNTDIMTIRADGNIGIGTLSPAYKLDVTGDINVSNRIYGTLGTAAQASITSVGTLTSLTVSGNAKANKLLVGTSTDSATTRLISALDSSMVSGDIRYLTLGAANSVGNQAEIGFYYFGSNDDNNAIRIGFSGAERMRIKKNGNVGIGNNSPAYTLDVSGSINFTSSLYNNGSVINFNYLSVTPGTAAASKALVLDSSYNISGIGGITATGYYVNTSGSNSQYGGNWQSSNYWALGPDTNTNDSTIRLGIAAGSPGGAWTGAYANLKLNKLIVNSTGNATPSSDASLYTAGGIYATKIVHSDSYGYFIGGCYLGGSYNASYLLYVNGAAAVTGNLTYYGSLINASDFRLKENIDLLDQNKCLNFINYIKPKTFNFKNKTGKYYGYIAQDLIKNEFNDLVDLEPLDDIKEYTDEDGFTSPENKVYCIKTQHIIPILHKTTKYLLDENEQLKNKNKELVERLERLEKILNL